MCLLRARRTDELSRGRPPPSTRGTRATASRRSSPERAAGRAPRKRRAGRQPRAGLGFVYAYERSSVEYERKAGCNRHTRQIDAIEADVVAAHRRFCPAVARLGVQQDEIAKCEVEAGVGLRDRRPVLRCKLVVEHVERREVDEVPDLVELVLHDPGTEAHVERPSRGIHANWPTERPRDVT